jgi:hypothetical protein
MIILKLVDLNYIGDFQLLNKFKYILAIFVLNNSYAQTENYEEYLRFLPDSVRSSVESRLSSDVEDNSNYEKLNNFQNNSNISNQNKSIQDVDDYGNEIPKLFGYDLFKTSNSFQPQGIIATPKDYVLGPGDELSINFSGSIQAIKKVSKRVRNHFFQWNNF